ncbi:MAG: M20/M25/M40 family metallo-hydrolase [bacterium]|nr:MAG: M20/M25/M40 family metallo-hydrolase [bacterium]
MDPSSKDRIVSFVKEHAEEQLEFVTALCNENSYTYNPEGTNRAAEMVLDTAGGLFPHHEVIDETEVGNHHILRSRTGSKAIYLLGHLDTVFPPDHPFQTCTAEGDWLTGPGTGDMKGGLAVLVYALKALQECGAMDRLDITLILGTDEEIGSAMSHTLYKRERKKAIACLTAECAGPNGEVVVSRNGKAGVRLDCDGEECHVGNVSGEKTSAVLEMAHKIIALESLNDYHPEVTVNVGSVEGGLGPSTVPGHASCLVDLRWRDEKHYDDLLEKVHGFARDTLLPLSRCRLTVLNHRPAMPLHEGTERMFDALERTAGLLGITIGREHRRGTSDANYFGSSGVPTLDGFGPVCEGDHTPRERILIPSLAERTTLLTLFLANHGSKLSTGGK